MSKASRESQPEFFDDLGEPSETENIKSHMRRRINPSVRISLEQGIAALVILILLFVMVFMLGVQRGKEIKNEVRKPASAPPTQSLSKPFTTNDRKPYTIQVAAYRQKDRALADAAALNAKGYHTRVFSQAGLFQVCIGAYEDRKDAADDFAVMRRQYPECYLRKILLEKKS